MFTRFSAIGFGVVALASIAGTGSAAAQRVSADIHIGGYPVSGTIHVGDQYPRPRRVVYERAYPRRIVVDRRRGWNQKHRNSRSIVVFYDRDCDIYFDRYHRGLQEIRVYQDGDRYYRWDDERYDGYGRDDRRDRDRRDWGRDRERYDRRDDRRNDRNDGDRWEHEHRH